MEVNFHPLFPQFFDPHIMLTASQQEESKCIADYLNGLPVSCHAWVSYELAIEFVRDTPERSILKARLFEVFVLWLFCVRNKPLSTVDAQDMAAFMAFYQSPPADWIREKSLCPRFVDYHRSEKTVNPDWRPISKPKPKALHSMKWVLRMFGEFLSNGAYGVISPPSLPAQPECDLQDASAQSLAYLKWLEQNCSLVKGGERILFVYACCHFFELSAVQFSSALPFFSMQNLSYRDDGWVLTLPLGGETIVRIVPPEFFAYLERYRAFAIRSGQYHGGMEEQLIDTKRRVQKSENFPKKNDHTPSAIALLRALSDIHKMKPQPHEDAVHRQLNSKTYRLRQSSHIEHNETLQKLYILSCASTNAAALPPIPLFRYPVDIDDPDSSLNRRGAQQLLESLYQGSELEKHLSEIDYFFNFALTNVGCVARLRLKAYETALLWSFLVKKLPISLLNVSDIEEFYIFCLNPPGNWCLSSPVRKFIEYNPALIPNPAWTPFMNQENIQDANAVKAHSGRIIHGCFRVRQAMIEMGMVPTNIFAPLAHEIWSVSPESRKRNLY
ncbi:MULTISPECIES: hypothetical protein [Pseudomonas]|uniref:hypothetical protein n=2 Tax=Pseudomonas TaxID=286 RepID=UPI00064C5A66|nr:MULTISPECIES: hypothetical protein [Pseudomonas]MBO2892109.1 hypothetical protein [Pseudomonas asiatica]MCK2122473.1 hypothetical protein [Pseudomonas sp. PNPG3]